MVRARSRPVSVDFFTTFRHPLVYVLTGLKKRSSARNVLFAFYSFYVPRVFFAMRSPRTVNTFWRSSRAAALCRENYDKRTAA